MSEQVGEKTELPTQRKLEDSLKRGQIPRSAEVQTVFVLLGGLAALTFAGALEQRYGVRTVCITRGGRGALVLCADGRIRSLRPYKVPIVDTTAAGDAFTAALAVGLAQGLDLAGAAQLANASGALACTKFGAQPSMPTGDEVRMLIKDQPQ